MCTDDFLDDLGNRVIREINRTTEQDEMPDFTYYDLVNAAIGAHRAYMNTEYCAACQYFKDLRDDLLKQARARIS